MRKVLVIILSVFWVSAVSLGQLTGKWEVDLHILPFIELEETTLTLAYTVAHAIGEVELGSSSTFTDAGFEKQAFSIKGSIWDLFKVNGKLAFNPSVPAYESSSIGLSAAFDGIRYNFSVNHRLVRNSPYMLYTLSIMQKNLSLNVHFDDDCTGIAFKDLCFAGRNLSLCCGIDYDFRFILEKEGFKYLQFKLDPLFYLCCDIRFGVEIEFGTDCKKVTPIIKWEGLKERCLEGRITVYGDVQWDEEHLLFEGLEIYAVKLNCKLAGCNTIEIFTTFDSDYNHFAPKLKENEFEYIKVGFCGPACCGNRYSLAVTTYFQAEGSMLGITRLVFETTLPLMDNLKFTSKMEVPVDGATSLDLGWEWEF